MLSRIVLVRPLYAGNVGSVVRVAANFEVPEVAVVSSAVAADDLELLRMAMGAERRVALRFLADLTEAVGDADMVIATTSSRERDGRGVESVAAARERVAASGARTVALVLGSERGGLSREELRLSHLRLTVPTASGFPVLNLAQAAAIVVSGLCDGDRTPAAPQDPMDRPAPLDELDRAMDHLQEALLASGYLDPHNPGRVADLWRRWLGRTVPTAREVALLHALAAHVTYLLGRSATRA